MTWKRFVNARFVDDSTFFSLLSFGLGVVHKLRNAKRIPSPPCNAIFFTLSMRRNADVPPLRALRNAVESRLSVQVGTQKFGRRTERDVQVKIIFRIRPC